MRRFLRVMKWILISLLCIPASLYFILLLINFRDSPPSELAQNYLADIAENDNALSNHLNDNAYVFVLGFDVSNTASPMDVGLERLKKLQHLGVMDKPQDNQQIRFEKPQLPLEQCIKEDDFLSSCNVMLKQENNLNALLDEYNWLIVRYQQLLNIGTWQDGSQFNVFTDSMPFTHLLAAQKLYLFNVLTDASTMDPLQVAEAINQDMLFWQRLSASTHMLIGKMMSNAGMEANMKLGELVMSQLPHSQLIEALPPSWKHALSPEVLSFDNVKRGEWYYFTQITRATQVTSDTDINTKLIEWLLLPLMQHQDTANRYAAILNDTAPLNECPSNLSIETFSQYIYNPVGKFILCSGIISLTPYQERFNRLEHQRAELVTRLPQDSTNINPTLTGQL